MSGCGKVKLPTLSEVKALLSKNSRTSSLSRVIKNTYNVDVVIDHNRFYAASEVGGLICQALVERFGYDNVLEVIDLDGQETLAQGSSHTASRINFPTKEVISLVAGEYGLGSREMCTWIAFNYGVALKPGGYNLSTSAYTEMICHALLRQGGIAPFKEQNKGVKTS